MSKASGRRTGPAGLRAASVLMAVLVMLPGGGCAPGEDGEQRLSVSSRLSDDAGRYRQVMAPRPLRFPADHGPHPRYKHEWWYLTGQAATQAGRRFGFQFTIFREAVSPTPVQSPSRWATSQVYLAHVAVTDVEGGRYLSDERYARGALGLAGAGATPLRVWLENWELAGRATAQGDLQGRVVVRAENFGFELDIHNTRAPVAHGDRGLSVKGAAGNASFYYSYTRLGVHGTIRVGEESFSAAGEAWFDHEWSSSALKADQSGWDWFSLQLADGAELMVFRLRHKEDPDRDFYNGTYVPASGRIITLADGQIELRALAHWTSERTGVRYPVRWRLEIPDLALSLTTEALLDRQEFTHSFRYWEGAVEASGERGARSLTGRGYVELAGYGAGR